MERVRTQEQIAVQEQEVLRKQRELEATVIKAAEAERQAAILRAEAKKQAAILEAEGSKAAQIAMAEAAQEKFRQEGLGQAAAIEAQGRAEAAKVEADRSGPGASHRGAGRCRGHGHPEEGGSVEGIQRGRQAPDDTRKDCPPCCKPQRVFSGRWLLRWVISIRVVVIEQGNGAAGDGTGGIGRIAKTGPALVFSLLQQLQALGLDVPSVLSQLGVSHEPAGRHEAAKEHQIAEPKALAQEVHEAAVQNKS